MNSIVERFEQIRWHDSKLLGLSLYRAGGEEQIKLLLELAGEDGRTFPADITFLCCSYLAASVYLDAKRLCADDIADAECKSSSDWKNSVSKPGPHDPILGGRHLEGHLHFRISMCPPSGDIDILAKDFALTSGVSAD